MSNAISDRTDCFQTTTKWKVQIRNMWIVGVAFWIGVLCDYNPSVTASSSQTKSDGSTSLTVSSCPSVCFCDETDYVNCVGDGLWDVPTDIPRTVARLELRNYVIGTLTVSVLHDIVDLSELKLQQTQIQSIENGTFGNLTKLLRLDLSQNLMERINSAMFEGLTSLRFLDLSTNRVVDMDEAFVDLVNLEQLNLRDNLLLQLTTKSFSGLYKVQYLNLDSNFISSIEVGTFQYLTNLAHLIVSNNPLTTLSRLDFFGSRLQYIDVSRVGLQRVPQSLTRYVRDLRLAKNNLTHIRLGDFDSYPYLSLLVLDDNKLTDIESDALGRQEYLVRLWLNGNRLQQIPANLPPSLRVLYVEENLLRALTAYSFQGLFNLEQLFLQRNQIKRLDSCAFCDLLNLRHLDLQANLLESITEGAFANLSNLDSLDLSQNPLKTLSAGCFNGLDVLKTLQLSRMKTPVQLNGSVFNPLKKLETLEVYDSPAFANQLVNSTRVLQGLRSVRELNLMHNNLITLRSDFPNFFPQLKVAKLSGNHWYCNRSILWLTTWIKKADTHFHHSYGIRCSQPSELLYRPIMMLKSDDFDPLLTSPPTTATTAQTLTPTTSNGPTLGNVTSRSTLTMATQTTNREKRPVTTPSSLSTLPSLTTTIKSNPLPTATITFLGNSNSSLVKDLNETIITKYVSTTTTPTTVVVVVTAASTAAEALPSTTIPTTVTVHTTQSVLSSTSFPKTLATATSNCTESVAATAMQVENDSAVSATLVHQQTTLANSQNLATNTEETVTVAVNINTSAAPNMSTNASIDHGNVKVNVGNELDGKENPMQDQALHVGEVQNDDSMVVAAASVATGLGLLLLGLTLSFFLFRCRKGYYSVSGGTSGSLSLNCQMRRSSSSISYSPQRDEVSIVTVSEGTVGLHTLTHQGLSNKLYFVLETGTDPSSHDLNKEALPDPSLRQLLPEAYPANVRHNHKSRMTPKCSTSTYCFT